MISFWKNRIFPKKSRKIFIKKAAGIVWPVVRTCLIAGLSFIILYPILVQLSSSFKSPSDLYDSSVYLIPRQPTWYNILRVIEHLDYPRTFMKTVIFSFAVSSVQAFSCTLVAYGLGRFNFPGKNLVFALVVFTLVIPPQLILLPLFMLFYSFNPLTILSMGLFNGGGIYLINSYLPFMLLSLTATGFKNGLYIYMLRQYFRNVPGALEEAAYIDGCGTFKTFIVIMLPGAIPIIVTVFLFGFVWQWNDYFYTSALAPTMGILTTGLQNIGYMITSLDGDVWNSLQQNIYNNVAVILQMIPLIILYIFTQKFFVESIERSGVVG
jgi:multiple sugar transport system permease protein